MGYFFQLFWKQICKYSSKKIRIVAGGSIEISKWFFFLGKGMNSLCRKMIQLDDFEQKNLKKNSLEGEEDKKQGKRRPWKGVIKKEQGKWGEKRVDK